MKTKEHLPGYRSPAVKVAKNFRPSLLAGQLAADQRSTSLHLACALLVTTLVRYSDNKSTLPDLVRATIVVTVMVEQDRERFVRSVLIIDDNELVLRSWDRALRAEGKHVVVATEFDEELELDSELDLAVVDLCLGAGGCGIDTIQRIKRQVPDVHAVLVSAAMSIPQAIRAMRAGADDCASKPIAPRELLKRVEHTAPATTELLTLEQVEWEHISRALADFRGNVSHAARALGVHRQSLQRKLRQRVGRDS